MSVGPAAGGHDAGDEERRRRPRARRRDRGQHLVGDGRLTPDALHVDDRRGPDTVIVSVTPPTDRLASIWAMNAPVSSTPSRLNWLKPGQRERHRIGSRRQADDSKESALVGHGRPHLFDQCRAGHLDRDARQCGAGGIPGRAGNRRLGERENGNKNQQRGERGSRTIVRIARLRSTIAEARPWGSGIWWRQSYINGARSFVVCRESS